mmetsp:Transcript_16307/g.33463  ORF Transcript_16307/g.33463 Transcript_16307/m.33463 type:complete len:82 (+) Transcript_16307:75-320(+)
MCVHWDLNCGLLPVGETVTGGTATAPSDEALAPITRKEVEGLCQSPAERLGLYLWASRCWGMCPLRLYLFSHDAPSSLERR